jgi:hypothetical protein
MAHTFCGEVRIVGQPSTVVEPPCWCSGHKYIRLVWLQSFFRFVLAQLLRRLSRACIIVVRVVLMRSRDCSTIPHTCLIFQPSKEILSLQVRRQPRGLLSVLTGEGSHGRGDNGLGRTWGSGVAYFLPDVGELDLLSFLYACWHMGYW